MERPLRIEQHSGLGGFWFAGWLFTIGYLKTSFWKGVLALLLWPYFLGTDFTPAKTPTPEIADQAAT